METFLRRLEILHFLQQRQASGLGPVGTDQVIQHLIDGEYVGEYLGGQARDPKSLDRLIQRDLKFLLGDYDEEDKSYLNPFGLDMVRGDRKTLLWSLDPYQQVSYDFEKMPAYMALALTITRKHLKQVLPSSTQHELAQVFHNAENKLEQAERKLSSKQYRRLGDAVEFYQRGQSLRTPDFDMATLDRIYQAILMGKRLKFSYHSATGVKEYDVHPFGVSIMLPKLYLVAVKDDDMKAMDQQHFRSFLIHRIEALEVSALSNQVPESFKLRDYLDAGNMDVFIDRDDAHHELIVELIADHESNLIRDLQDSPLNDSQVLTEIKPGVWHLCAQVRRTVQLRTWLLALGAQAKVIQPAVIRDDLLNSLRAITERYA